MTTQKNHEIARMGAATEQAGVAGLVSFAEVTAPKIEQGGPVGKGQFVYVDISSIDNKLKRITEPKTLEVCVAPSRAKQRLRAGDVLVSMTRPNLNAVAIVPSELEGAVGSTGFHVLRASPETEPRWLYYAVQTHRFISSMSELVQGALYPAVRPKDIRAFEIPHPPLDQQKRIVAEIEKQFSRLDEAVANLKRVKANLKRYKAAVLKAAVEGRLVETEAELARREGRSYETGEQLLQRILETRRSQWKGKGKYKEPAAPDTTDLPELPEGWVWATVEQITTEMMNGYGKRSQTVGHPHIVLRLADIVDGQTSFKDIRRINCTEDEFRKYILSEGDLLILRVNGSSDLVGRFVLVHATPEPMLFCDHFIRARCASPDLAVWLRLYADVERFRRYIDLNKVSSAGQNTINQGVLNPFTVPLPPDVEQRRIVAELDRRLSLIREVESQVQCNFSRSDRLRQSILTTAFSGKVVCSDGMRGLWQAQSVVKGR